MSFDKSANSLHIIFKKISGDNLFSLLNSIDGPKDLVLDKEIISSLDYIASFSQLKKCGVERIYKLEAGTSPGNAKKCIYLIKPKIQNTKLVCDHINSCKSVGNHKKFWIIYVPRKINICEVVLEKEGVYGHVTQLQLPIGFYALDQDLFSLEIQDFYKCFYLKGDLTYVHNAAMSLVQLCTLCGSIPKIFGQGKCAKMVIDLMNQMLNKDACDSPVCDRISHLVILDRDIDYVSVLLSQLTYEGMLDEVFGFNSGRVSFPKEVTGKNEPLKVTLNSSDLVYEEIRNSYFSSVFGFLRDKAKRLQAKSETSGMSLGDIKNFINKEMKNVQQEQASLSLHIGACEVILKRKNKENFQALLQTERDIIENQNTKKCIDYIEDVINKQDPFSSALRLLCLLSIAQEGLQSSDYRSLMVQFRQSYGCKFVMSLHNLKKLGILVEQNATLPSVPSMTSKLAEVASAKATKIAEKVATAVAFPKYNSFKTVTKKFNLIPSEEQPDLKNPKTMGYVFGGAYIPLTGRIVEQIVANGSLHNIEDSMKLLPGSTIINFESEKGHVKPMSKLKSKTIMVYMLGGITFAEVAALRLLANMHDCQILIATTSILNGESLMKMVSPTEE